MALEQWQIDALGRYGFKVFGSQVVRVTGRVLISGETEYTTCTVAEKAPRPHVGQVWTFKDNSGEVAEVLIGRVTWIGMISVVGWLLDGKVDATDKWPPRDAVLVSGPGAPWYPPEAP